jgi:glutamate formiminotransferase
MELVELIPNVSEGRSPAKVDELASALGSGSNVWLLDVHRDESQHRSVLTAVARPESVVAAAARLLEHALSLIDLRVHRGEHPRFGALDVFPLVPLGGVTLPEAVALAGSVGEELSQNYDVPVFLYGAAARSSAHRHLPHLRRGGFEALERRMESGELVADFGPPRPHPTGGACAVGVRDFLIAYNVELRTGDRRIAATVARAVRGSSGGLPHVQALGFARTSGSGSPAVQVSMNLTDFRVTSMLDAFEAVKSEAERHGVEVLRSEIVGLVPKAALFPGMTRKLRLEREPGVLEERIRDHLIP